MTNSILKYALSILLATTFFSSPALQAADEPIDEKPTSRDEILTLIRAGLPEPLTGNISELVSRMMAVKLGPPLSSTFDPKLAIQRLLGRGAVLEPSCRQLFTRSGELNRLPCNASVGTADGTGAYKHLGYSKHMALGNLCFFDRPADKEIGIGDLIPVKMTDEDAYSKAREWLASNFGLGSEEIPQPPADVQNPYPVRTIAMSALTEGARVETVEVEKLVMLRRGLFAGLGKDFDWLPAPGTAMVALTDEGIQQASVSEWQELMPNPDVNPDNAKTSDQLINEIADDLLGMMRGPVDRIQIGLIYGVTAPTDDKDARGLLLPAVQVFVSSVPADLTEEEQELLGRSQVSTASSLREYSLVNFPAETRGDN